MNMNTRILILIMRAAGTRQENKEAAGTKNRPEYLIPEAHKDSGAEYPIEIFSAR